MRRAAIARHVHREADQPAAQVATAGFPAFVDARGNASAMRRAHEPVDVRQPRKHHVRAAGRHRNLHRVGAACAAAHGVAVMRRP
ncbi:hypothetical protein WS65_17230 [Burkholderia anthina]|nr:hypothetical protein WS65_17230 [Burkholderia anthina]